MGSKSYTSTDIDNAAQTATDSASVQKIGDRNAIGNTALSYGASQTITSTDLGAIHGGLNLGAGAMSYSADITGKLLDSIGTWTGSVADLTRQTIAQVSDNQAKNTSSIAGAYQSAGAGIADAYRGASGNINWNALGMTAAVAVVFIAGIYLVSRQ